MKILATPRPLSGSARAFLRSSRGAATITFGLGAVLLITVALATFELTAYRSASAEGGRMVAAMADYASREETPDGGELEALGEYLVEHQSDRKTDVVFLISMVERDSTTTGPEVLRTQTVAVPVLSLIHI